MGTGGAHPPHHGFAGAAAVVAASIAIALWVSIFTNPMRLARGLLDARTHLSEAEKRLQQGEMKKGGLAAARAVAAATVAHDALEDPDPFLDLVRLVPRAARVLDEVPHLADAALSSAKAALSTAAIAQNVLRGPGAVIQPDPDDPKGGSIVRVERVRAIGTALAGVRDLVIDARRSLRAVEIADLPQRARSGVRNGIRTAAETKALLDDAVAGFAILPSFLGADEPRTYLIGMQNSAEQRGTGGAILQFALLAISEGKPSLPKTRGTIYKFDIERRQIDIPLPDDAWYVAAIPDAQRFGNSNWSPDWPLSARLLLRYGRASDETFPDVDGVLAVDPLLMQELLPGIGKYQIKSGNRITTKKVVHFVLYKAYASYPATPIRRHVLAQVVDGFYRGLLAPKHPTLLMQGFARSLAEKHVQVWLRDPAEQAFVARMNWDGGIAPAPRADYLSVVEQNVGGNKLDNFGNHTTTARVSFEGADALVSATAEVENRIFLPQPRWAMGDSGPIHLPMMNVYVPENAELTSWTVDGTRTDANPPPAQWVDGRPPEYEENGKKVWPATLEIPPGESASITYDYRVPGVVATVAGRKVYRLTVQHQPRIRPERLIVSIRLPEGATGIRARGFERKGGVVVWDRPLRQDVTLEVSWRD